MCDVLHLYIELIRFQKHVNDVFKFHAELIIKLVAVFLLLSPAKKTGISSCRSWIKHSTVTAIRPCCETKQPCGWGPFPSRVQRGREGGKHRKL